jgi:hypothetical protein
MPLFAPSTAPASLTNLCEVADPALSVPVTARPDAKVAKPVALGILNTVAFPPPIHLVRVRSFVTLVISNLNPDSTPSAPRSISNKAPFAPVALAIMRVVVAATEDSIFPLALSVPVTAVFPAIANPLAAVRVFVAPLMVMLMSVSKRR